MQAVRLLREVAIAALGAVIPIAAGLTIISAAVTAAGVLVFLVGLEYLPLPRTRDVQPPISPPTRTARVPDREAIRQMA